MLKVVHLELQEANSLVIQLHRHHKPVQGHRFSIGAVDNGNVVGAAIVGRPVSRKTNHKLVVEVTRLVTDGAKNACSFLYSAAARSARELGYQKIQTFILNTEPGTSLLAAGWTCEDSDCGGGNWNNTVRTNRKTDQPMGKKQRWSKVFW